MISEQVTHPFAQSDPGIAPAVEGDSSALRRGLIPDFDSCHHPLKNAVVMIVDDEPTTIEVVQMFLEERDYRNFVICNDSTRAIEALRFEQPDIVLLDLNMPHTSGFDVLEQMRADNCLKHIPVIMLTSEATSATKLKALELGATDLLAKPLDPSELEMRLRNTLAAKAFHDQLLDHSVLLEHQVRLRTAQLEAAQQHVIYCLARAGEFRDNQTGKHVARVGRFASIIARQLGFDSDWVKRIEQAAQLHDVGKIGISDSILRKPGRLTPKEYDQIKTHCEIGKSIIQPSSEEEWRKVAGISEEDERIPGLVESPTMRMAAVIAATHQEKWDGTGYPRGLKGDEIPIEGRIVAVVDVYDAVRSERPYKEAFPQDECFAIIRDERGKHFDPRVVDAFFAAADEIVKVQQELAD